MHQTNTSAVCQQAAHIPYQLPTKGHTKKPVSEWKKPWTTFSKQSEWTISTRMTRQCKRTYQHNERGDRESEPNDSHEIPDRRT